MTRRFCVMMFVCVLGAELGWARDYYVWPQGSDGNRGSREQPFASLRQARDAIREAGIAGKEPVTVFLMDGIHLLPETFVLGPRDSGKAAAPVVYKAQHEGKAVVSGAKVLEGLAWEPHRDGIMRARISRAVLDSCAFDAISVGPDKLHMARFPNFTGHGNFDGVTKLQTINQRAEGYIDPSTGYVHALHRNRWGSVHYRITGRTEKGLSLAGGWQQNRHRQLNANNVMIENIFEELDAPGEWFLDRKAGVLYIYPPEHIDLARGRLYVTNLRHLIEFQGSAAEPVRHVTIQGIEFRHARRVCLEDEDQWEGLNRGDWSIVRSAAVMLTGTEYCAIRDCFFNQLSGNGVFFNHYHRRSEITGSRFHKLGESAVCFVGNAACTRSNPVGYENSIAYSQQDLTPGPRGKDYPRYCKMDDCLVFNIGRLNKQTAGAFISMAEDITISHNTIFHVPRSGITVNDGCWGGHLLEYNDVFDTVIETGDHGPFNSWGRDRYWLTAHHSKKAYRAPTEYLDESVSQAEARDRSRLDCRTPIVIRNNRWWHAGTHTWGIDLDDGSSNYHVYNNLGLGCSVKLREGFYRRVENNVFIGGEAIQFHVPFDYNSDIVCRNIVVPATPKTMPWKNPMEKLLDAAEIDYNLYWSYRHYADPKLDHPELKRYQGAGLDTHSLCADPQFIDPLNYDLRVAPGSPALALGFKNFPMTGFGVRKPAFQKLAQAGHKRYNRFDALAVWGHHVKQAGDDSTEEEIFTLLGAQVKDLTSDAEQSVAGVGRKSGVFVLKVPKASKAYAIGIRETDAIMAVNGQAICNVRELKRALRKNRGRTVGLHVVGAEDRVLKLQVD